MYVIKQPLPVAPAANSVTNVLAEWNAIYDAYNKSLNLCLRNKLGWRDQLEHLGYVLPQDLTVGLILNGLTKDFTVGLILNGLTKDFTGFVIKYNMHNIEKTIGELHDMLIEYEKGLPKKAETPQVMMIKGEHPAKDDTCHHCKEEGHWKRNFPVYLAELLKKKQHVVSAKIDMHDLVPNFNSICNVSTKRAKHNLDSTYLWHCRLAHISKQRIEMLQQEGLLKSTDDESFDHYVSCLSGKMTRKSFSHHTERATDLLGIIHTDVYGPLRHVSRQGVSYFITFMDDYSRYGYVYILKHKHEAFETFKVFKNEVKNQLRKIIKALGSNQGGKYISQEFKDYLKACGIVQQLTPPYTPQHNESATHILNMVPTKKVDKTPYELWYGKVPNLSYLKDWGCEALVKQDTPDKLQQRSVKCIFIGYPKETTEAEEHSQGDLNEPASYKAAMLDSESNKWIDAMNAEIQSIIDNMVWVLVDLPSNCKTVGSKWNFKKNTDMDGIVHSYKARLVAKRHLYGTTDGFIDPNHLRKVCKLQRPIYGLKQISRRWNKSFDKEIKKFGFAQNLDEPCVYKKASGTNVTFFILYVDDIIIIGNHIPILQSVKDYLEKCFAMKDLRESAFILGIKIYQDGLKQLIGFGQNAYMDNILRRYELDNSKRGHIYMQEKIYLNKTQGVVDWKSFKQSTTVMSATEAEYIAVSEAAMEAVWIRKFISGLDIVPTINKPIRMFYDNSVVLHFANELGVQRGTRHYHRRYHYVRESIALGKIRFFKVHTDDNLVDPFTKALSKGKLTQHARSTGLRLASSFMIMVTFLSLIMNNHNFHNSYENRMQKISKSVFVTNFPKDSTARDLWKVCSDYGTVVDVFIPFNRSKSGKRFAFVRLIKEFDFGMYLMGRAKDVFAIPNLPCSISKEGFQNVKLSYLGGMWVFFECDSLASKEKFLNHSEVAMCLGLRFSLEALRFVFKDLAFCLGSIAFCLLQRSCVLSQKHCVLSTSKILRFASEALRFVYVKDIAFCLRNTAFCNKNLRPIGDALRKCILSGPYKPTTVLVQAVEATDDSPAIPEHMTVETPMNMSPENKAHFQAEKEAIHLILTRIGDEIYSTIDACQIAHEMWEAIERHKGKEIAKPITPPPETTSKEDGDPEQAQRDKDMQKNLALIAKTVNVAGARENVGSPVMQQSGIQCFNCKEFGHFAKECIKLKRVKDSAYHKEKMLLCKQAEKGVPLQAEQYDWLTDTDEEIDEQELEAHYSYMAKIQVVPTADSGTDSEPLEQVQNDTRYNVFTNALQHSKQFESINNTCLVETNDSNVILDSPYMYNDDIYNDQNDVESNDERVALANLIANLKLDVD
nr:hypothetical protein [Tanacetum cinerariifolium]